MTGAFRVITETYHKTMLPFLLALATVLTLGSLVLVAVAAQRNLEGIQRKRARCAAA